MMRDPVVHKSSETGINGADAGAAGRDRNGFPFGTAGMSRPVQQYLHPRILLNGWFTCAPHIVNNRKGRQRGVVVNRARPQPLLIRHILRCGREPIRLRGGLRHRRGLGLSSPTSNGDGDSKGERAND